MGTPTSGPSVAHSGQNCAATVLAGNYEEPVSSRLTRFTSFIVPGSSQHPRLRFWHWYSFSDADTGFVQIKIEGGDWQKISDPYFNTSSDVWSYTSIDLSSFAGSTVQVAFLFTSQYIWPEYASTGWYIDQVAVITGPMIFNNPEEWEIGIGDWYVDRGTWEVGVPSSGPDSAHSGQNCAATVLAGNYHDKVASRFISPPFVVPSVNRNPRLGFWHWYSFSEADTGFVKIKIESGDWQTALDTFYNTSSDVWSYASFDISSFASSTVQVAFFFTSHYIWPEYTSAGWYIDQVEIMEFNEIENSQPLYTVISSYILDQNYPNPFNSNTTISYRLLNAGNVALTIYNALGEKVKTLFDEQKQPGQYQTTWDSRNEAGWPVASGIYFYKLKIGDSVQTRKMLLLR